MIAVRSFIFILPRGACSLSLSLPDKNNQSLGRRLWFEPRQDAAAFVVQQIQTAVGAGAHVADAPERALEHSFLAHHLFAVEAQAYQHLVLERADEEIAPPERKFV